MVASLLVLGADVVNILVIIGCAMIAAGLIFAVRQIASDTAGGTALKGIALSGPAWLVLIGMGVGLIVFDRWLDHDTSKTVEDKQTASTTPPTEPDEQTEQNLFPNGFTYGDNNDLDKLWRECDRSIWASCDQLYIDSDIESDYEYFGATCGGLPFNPNPNTEWCDPTNEG